MRLARIVSIALFLLIAAPILTSCQPDPVTVLTSQRALAPDEPPESFEQRFLDYTAAVWYQRTLAFAAAIHYQKVLAFAAAVEAARTPSYRPVWDRVAACESGGNWAETAGTYEGGLQFLRSTWLSVGGGQYAQHAYDATKYQQIEMAERLLARSGVMQWPVCGPRAGLTRV